MKKNSFLKSEQKENFDNFDLNNTKYYFDKISCVEQKSLDLIILNQNNETNLQNIIKKKQNLLEKKKKKILSLKN